MHRHRALKPRKSSAHVSTRPAGPRFGSRCSSAASPRSKGRPTPDGRATRPPFPLGRPGRPWMEQSLARMAEQQFVTDLLRHDSESGPCFTDEANETIENHWDAAPPRRSDRASGERAPWNGSRATSTLSTPSCCGSAPVALRLRPAARCPGRHQAPAACARRARPAHRRPGARPSQDLEPRDRDLIVTTQQAAVAEARRQVRRLSSFTRVLYATAVALTVGAIVFAAVGVVAPRARAGLLQPGGRRGLPDLDDSDPEGQEEGRRRPAETRHRRRSTRR